MKKRSKRNSEKPKKQIEKICKNCLLYDGKKAICRVVIPMPAEDGTIERINLPMYPSDPCFFEEEIITKDENNAIVDRFTPKVEQVKWWVEDPKTGKKSDKGIVKIEFPDAFFGKDIGKDLDI
jgi:hypothetical protein